MACASLSSHWGVLADEHYPLAQRKVLASVAHGCVESCLSDYDCAGRGDHPPELPRVPILQLHAEAHSGDVTQVRIRELFVDEARQSFKMPR
jgi:hypothetical protein